MVDSGLLAQRLRWARKEQSVTLQQLSERSGRAVSYLSQLEHGVKDNPTRQTVELLAHALGVRPAFLFGEVSGPAHGDRSQAGSAPAAILQAFRRYVADLSVQRRRELEAAEPAARFAEIVSFLVWHHPESFTHIELAFQLGISYAYYREIIDNGAEVSHYIAEQLARVSGVPVCYLTHGTFAEPAEPALAADALRYVEAIRLALEHRFTPEDLERLILAASASR
ncbi:MAG TPA: helix-turn-helix transcriptional regulator [Symbiobacteriaceae bacterium]|nr:helix-turn-helix transcriptional regulator [Symbiobacteriaceae bacterium]